MNSFDYFQPTQIHYGTGRLNEVGDVVARYGKRCLLVTEAAESAPPFPALFERVHGYLKGADVVTAHFDGVVPNPTTDCITAGAEMAKEFGADVVLGVGGGSSMDAAKAIAVEVTHPGTAWDYRWCCETQPTERTLPIVAVTTTSGTGSEVTRVAVLTNTAQKDKSAIVNPMIYPRAAIVDPRLTLTVPPHVTASTGFDAFAHAFEAYLHPTASPHTGLFALEAIRLVVEFLPAAVEDGSNLEAREALAWANTLGGLSIASSGTTLPHGIGMTIGGYCPHVKHGEALAVTYPEFTRFTFPYAIERFATVGRTITPELVSQPDEVAAERSCEAVDAFLKEIGMWLSLESLKVPEDELAVIADHSQVLGDYKMNPRIATRDEIFEILKMSYRR